MGENLLNMAKSYVRSVGRHVQAVVTGQESPAYAWKRLTKRTAKVRNVLMEETIDHEKAARLVKRAKADYKAGNYTMALDTLQESLQYDQAYPLAYAFIGYTYLKLQRPNQAVENFAKAIELDPDSEGANKARKALKKLTAPV